MLRVTIAHNHSELSVYSDAIETLVSEQAGPAFFLTVPYQFSWLATFEADKNIVAMLMFDQEQLVGFAPFLIIDGLAKNIGDGLWGYSGVAWKPAYRAAVLDLCNATLRSHGANRVEMGPVYEDAIDDYWSHLSTMPNASLEPLPGAPLIETSLGLQAYKDNQQKSTYADAVHQEQRLAALGALRIEWITPLNANEESIETALDLFLQLYNLEFPAGRFIRIPQWRDMYLMLANACIQLGKYLEFTLLILDDTVIAAHYGFISHGRYYYFTPTYDLQYAAYSPGNVLLKNLIDSCFERGLTFDFQNDEEEHKQLWTDKVKRRVWVQYDLVNDLRKVLYQSATSLVYDQIIDNVPCRNFILGPDFVFRQGAISRKDPNYLILNFTANLFFGSFFVENISTALCLGLGIGAVPRALKKIAGPKVKIDVVDINLEVIQLAAKFFEFNPADFNIFNADAAVFVKQIPAKKYDYICVDIWDDTGVPAFLQEIWFWEFLLNGLNPGGAISFNAPQHLHQEFCTLLSTLVPHFFSLAGKNASFLIPGSDMGMGLQNMDMGLQNRNRLAAYKNLGADVEKIMKNTLSIRKA